MRAVELTNLVIIIFVLTPVFWEGAKLLSLEYLSGTKSARLLSFVEYVSLPE